MFLGTVAQADDIGRIRSRRRVRRHRIDRSLRIAGYRYFGSTRRRARFVVIEHDSLLCSLICRGCKRRATAP
jgi:hypothetical protein